MSYYKKVKIRKRNNVEFFKSHITHMSNNMYNKNEAKTSEIDIYAS